MKLFLRKSRILLIGLIAVLFGFTQLIRGQEFETGIKGGFNLSYLSTDDANDNNIIPGFHAGVFANFDIANSFGIQPEVLFSTKGMKTIYDEDFLGVSIADGKSKLNINYIDVPLYLKFNLADDFALKFGPYLGLLVNADFETDAEVLSFIDIDTEDEIDKNSFNLVDYGISGGLEFSIYQMIMGFNYSLGLNEVAKEGESMELLLGNARNNSIQLYAGFVF